MSNVIEKDSSLDKIEADYIVVEVTDKDTGKLFRRSLPVSYFENSNGVVLCGESLDGTPAQIALYSNEALLKINDLLGKGPDAPQCKHE